MKQPYLQIHEYRGAYMLLLMRGGQVVRSMALLTTPGALAAQCETPALATMPIQCDQAIEEALYLEAALDPTRFRSHVCGTCAAYEPDDAESGSCANPGSQPSQDCRNVFPADRCDLWERRGVKVVANRPEIAPKTP